MLEATSHSILISNRTGTFSKKRADFISTCQLAAKASEVEALLLPSIVHADALQTHLTVCSHFFLILMFSDFYLGTLPVLSAEKRQNFV